MDMKAGYLPDLLTGTFGSKCLWKKPKYLITIN